MPYSVSVIVPVYGVEVYVERCVRSLMEQTMQALEVIFVDDCSPDRSMEIVRRVVDEYPHRREHVRIITQPKNMGVAAARTAAMKVMQGEYMAHCDADDWIDLDSYQRLYTAAVASGADMVSCRYRTESQGKVEGVCFSGSAIDCLKKGQYTYGLWDKLIRSSIIQDNEIYPFPGINYNEDLNVIIRALCYCNKVVGIDDAMYHHLMGREGSICYDNYRHHVLEESVPSMRLLDAWLDDFGKKNNRSDVNHDLTLRPKFWMKSGFYKPGMYKEWSALWPECRKIIPKISSLTFKEKILMLVHTFKQ